jgi:hypothetical protein
MKKTLRTLLDAVAEQRAKSSPEGDGDYCLRYGDLDRVEKFLLSFDEPGALERNQPAVAELAERLAKVEDRLATNESALRSQMQRVETLEEQRLAAAVAVRSNRKVLDDRIDKVTEIIGERVSGLVEQIDALVGLHANLEHLDPATVTVQDVLRTLRVARIFAPDFPTGGASTAEAAADAVLLVPQRGDRVRLEGARSVVGSAIADGWYDVLGFAGAPDNPQFQIRVRDADLGMQGIDTPAYSPWLFCGQPSLKEVRHADHT